MKVGEIIWRYLQAEKIPARRVALLSVMWS